MRTDHPNLYGLLCMRRERPAQFAAVQFAHPLGIKDSPRAGRVRRERAALKDIGHKALAGIGGYVGSGFTNAGAIGAVASPLIAGKSHLGGEKSQQLRVREAYERSGFAEPVTEAPEVYGSADEAILAVKDYSIKVKEAVASGDEDAEFEYRQKAYDALQIALRLLGES